MPGKEWVDPNVDLCWLLARMEDFSNACADNTMRVSNPVRDTWFRKLITDYEARFPGRIAAWEFPKLHGAKTEAERDVIIISVSLQAVYYRSFTHRTHELAFQKLVHSQGKASRQE